MSAIYKINAKTFVCYYYQNFVDLDVDVVICCLKLQLHEAKSNSSNNNKRANPTNKDYIKGREKKYLEEVRNKMKVCFTEFYVKVYTRNEKYSLCRKPLKFLQV